MKILPSLIHDIHRSFRCCYPKGKRKQCTENPDWRWTQARLDSDTQLSLHWLHLVIQHISKEQCNVTSLRAQKGFNGWLLLSKFLWNLHPKSWREVPSLLNALPFPVSHHSFGLYSTISSLILHPLHRQLSSEALTWPLWWSLNLALSPFNTHLPNKYFSSNIS